MTQTSPRLQITGLVQRFELGPDQPPLTVLDGIDLELHAGESLAIVGPSGSGKSTLLHVAAGLVPPSEGRVCVDGRELSTLDPDELAELRNSAIGMVFQEHHLLPQCTVLENVLVPTLAGWDGPGPAESRAHAEGLLERVGLSHRLTHRPGRLSGGERQRVAVVRALINRPGLLLADEPTGSLDARSSDELAELLRELEQELGVALLVVTHSPELARRMGSVRELVAGKLPAPG